MYLLMSILFHFFIFKCYEHISLSANDKIIVRFLLVMKIYLTNRNEQTLTLNSIDSLCFQARI